MGRTKQKVHLEPGRQPGEIAVEKGVKAGEWIKPSRLGRHAPSRRGKKDSASIQPLGIRTSTGTHRQGKTLSQPGSSHSDGEPGQEVAYKLSAWASIYSRTWALQSLEGDIARDTTDVWDKSHPRESLPTCLPLAHLVDDTQRPPCHIPPKFLF